MTGVVVLIVEAAASGQRQNLVWLRALRALRALRPLRAASRAEGIRVVSVVQNQGVCCFQLQGDSGASEGRSGPCDDPALFALLASCMQVVSALFKAFPALGNVLLVAGLFYFVFAILVSRTWRLGRARLANAQSVEQESAPAHQASHKAQVRIINAAHHPHGASFLTMAPTKNATPQHAGGEPAGRADGRVRGRGQR